MKFDSKALALSFGAVSGIVSAVCALLLLIAPGFAFTLANYIAHGADFTKIAKPVTFGGAIIGTILVAAFAYAAAYVFAELYNYEVREK